MASGQVFPRQVQQQEEESILNIYTAFLDAVKKGTKDQVKTCATLINSATNEGRKAAEAGEEGENIEPNRSTESAKSKSHRQKLLEALEKKDPGAVWNLIAEGNEEEVKTLETLNEVCESVADRERLKEAGLFKCLWGKFKSQVRCNGRCGCCSNCRGDEQQKLTEFQNEEEQQWIRILSDPLYISLEWLWRHNPHNPASKTPVTSEEEETKEVNESKLADVIEAALHDAHLLEKIALFEHHFSRDEYTRRAEVYETFATDVVAGSNLEQLHVIMDIDGTGCLLQERPKEFNQSLSLLKIAADKERKKFVASPKCQYILNEIIYYEWPHWQNINRTTKFAWSFLQLVFVAISSVFYVPLRLARKFPCCDERWWEFREMYEHPYSKFINHTTWYLVFLGFIILTSFEHEFGTTVTGLVWIDFVVLSFVVGLLLQEILEARRQGFYIYMSKWWNVVDTMIIVTFLMAYAVWLLSWVRFGKWKPQKPGFVLADVLYASAIVMAFFHLTHIFQIDSVLGPLQLSLYKMLKDVRRFLLVFLLLYISFATGVAKVYSYYVASQIELSKQNVTHYQESHPYASHVNALIGLFWLLLGLVEEDKISVKDPAFRLTSAFGRLFLMTYVVCMVIVALNMLIAMMNNSFDRIMENADIEWRFSRARMWLEWIDKGNTMPAPLNIVYYILHFIVKRFANCFRLLKERCQCCERQGDEEEANREREDAKNRKERRMETMKDLVVKYLKHHYFDEVEKNSPNDTEDTSEATSSRGKGPQNIQDNINLLRRLVDRQVKELAELNKKVDSMVKSVA